MCCILFFIATPLFAADIFFEPEKNIGLQDQFKMNVFLDTEEPLNAIEGTVRFPTDLLEFKSLEDGNSIVNFWLEHSVSGKTGEVVFSGITPGGYQGSKGLIFSMTFLVKQEGRGTFSIHNAQVLQNDGKGTEAKLQTFDSQFIISKKISGIRMPVSETKDGDPPESFTPEIAQSPEMFDGKWFLVFVAQDKSSGIAHYEVKESRQKIFSVFRRWSQAESPYVLKDQELRSFIFVQAIDKDGNVRIADIAPRNPLPWYKNYENWVMIIGGIFIVVFAMRKLWRKKHISN